MKTCKHCEIDLSTVKHEGLQCKTCRNGIARYGLNRKQQLELLESQEHKCAICDKKAELFVNNNQLGVIDHCHATGKVRGILCGGCNTALGKIEAIGIDRLERFAEYVSQ